MNDGSINNFNINESQEKFCFGFCIRHTPKSTSCKVYINIEYIYVMNLKIAYA